MILLDTHVLVWLAQGSQRLGPRSRRLIDRNAAGDLVAIAAISFWEIAMLVRKGRLDLGASPESFRHGTLQAGVREIPLSGAVAIAAADLERFRGDPADRIIVATAIACGAALVTADAPILGWKSRLKRHDARK